MGKVEKLKTYYSLHSPKNVPVDTFALWNMTRDELNPHNEATKMTTHFVEPDEITPLSPRPQSPRPTTFNDG